MQSWFPHAAEAALWQAVRKLKLADLYFKCQGCFTLAFQIPLAFFNPSLGPCLKQHCFREALVQPELCCHTAGVTTSYSCVSFAFYTVVLASLAGLCCLHYSCEVSCSNGMSVDRLNLLDDQMNLQSLQNPCVTKYGYLLIHFFQHSILWVNCSHLVHVVKGQTAKLFCHCFSLSDWTRLLSLPRRSLQACPG